jgi:Uma2 family endonuclease
MGEAARKRITIDEFLAWDSGDDRHYELVGGEIVAMSPPSPFHGAIVANAAIAIGQKLKPPCRVVSEAGIRLSWRNDAYYQADLAVTCTPLKQDDWAMPNPVVIIEVFSPSTMAHDKAVKLVDYRHIPSVEAIVFIASDERRVELWRRGQDLWTVVELESGGRLALDVLEFDIPVEALYEGLDLSQNADAPRADHQS